MDKRADFIFNDFFPFRCGNQLDFHPHQMGEPIDPPFPSGVVQRTRTYGLQVRWELNRNQWIQGAWAFTQGRNLGNVRDANEDSHSFRLEVRFEFL